MTRWLAATAMVAAAILTLLTASLLTSVSGSTHAEVGLSPLLSSPPGPTATPLTLPRAGYLPLVPKDPSPTPTSTPSPSASDFAVLSSTNFIYSLGGTQLLVVIGEIQNLSGQYRNPGTIQVVFYNASGGIVGVRNTTAFTDAVAPGDKACFRYETPDIPPEWVRYDFYIIPTQTWYTQARLAVSGLNTAVDSSDRLHVLGAVTNDATGGNLYGYVKVFVATYDESGGVKNASYTIINVQLFPNAKAFFDIPMGGPKEYTTLEVKAYAMGPYSLASPTPTRTSTITPTPTRTSTPSPLPTIPHTLEGRSACTTCHQVGGSGVGVPGGTGMPNSHLGRTDSQCLGCHSPILPTPTVTPTPTPMAAPAATPTPVV